MGLYGICNDHKVDELIGFGIYRSLRKVGSRTIFLNLPMKTYDNVPKGPFI